MSLPAKMHHYAWTATPTVVQITFEGLFDVFYVNPSDDPRRKKSNRRTPVAKTAQEIEPCNAHE